MQKRKTYRDVCRPAAIMKGNILYFMEMGNYTTTELARAMCVSKSTVERRMREPWTFTVKEINLLEKYFSLKPGQLLIEPKHEPIPIIID